MSPERPFHRIVEAILFASQKPLSTKELAAIFKGAADAAKEDPEIAGCGKPKPEQFVEAIHQLEIEYTESGRAFEVRESAAGWQLVTRADFAPWLRQIFPENRSARLSAPALETLAIIAYRQPITRAHIEAVRGVAVDGVMQTILDRGLIRIAGRAEVPGRPLLYETTQFFMEHFGLKDLDDLPNAGELRRIALPTAVPPSEQQPATAAEVVAAPDSDTPSVPAESIADTEKTPADEPLPAGDFSDAVPEAPDTGNPEAEKP